MMFKSRAECEGELINAYAGTTWEIEKQKILIEMEN